MTDSTVQLVRSLADVCKQQKVRLALAESCSGGAAATLITSQSGASDYFCGSFVTYRPCCKREWLGISAETLQVFTAESPETTRELAIAVLQKTCEANWSAAITGHLGPLTKASETATKVSTTAESSLNLESVKPDGGVDRTPIDGQVFVCIARRNGNEIVVCHQATRKLKEASRAARQQEAAHMLLSEFLDQLHR